MSKPKTKTRWAREDIRRIWMLSYRTDAEDTSEQFNWFFDKLSAKHNSEIDKLEARAEALAEAYPQLKVANATIDYYERRELGYIRELHKLKARAEALAEALGMMVEYAHSPDFGGAPSNVGLRQAEAVLAAYEESKK